MKEEWSFASPQVKSGACLFMQEYVNICVYVSGKKKKRKKKTFFHEPLYSLLTPNFFQTGRQLILFHSFTPSPNQVFDVHHGTRRKEVVLLFLYQGWQNRAVPGASQGWLPYGTQQVKAAEEARVSFISQEKAGADT